MKRKNAVNIATKFVLLQNGKYDELLSSKFLHLFIHRKIWSKYREAKQPQDLHEIENIVYSVGKYIFEDMIERDLAFPINGHHVAQQLSSLVAEALKKN